MKYRRVLVTMAVRTNATLSELRRRLIWSGIGEVTEVRFPTTRPKKRAKR